MMIFEKNLVVDDDEMDLIQAKFILEILLKISYNNI